jgi:acetoin utilization deacetylase AcuC-like enzyme
LQSNWTFISLNLVNLFIMIKVAWHPDYIAPLPEKHRFPMAKYDLIPSQLIHHGIIDSSQLFQPEIMSNQIILKVHDETYLNDLETGSLNDRAVRKLGLPLTPLMVEREKRIMQGTLDNVLFALESKVSFNVAGGTHHSYRDSGEGFCLLNDIAIAAQCLLEDKGLRSLVVDLDVHQGNGTAKIFENQPDIFTFSMHGEKNYPLKKDHSDLDIGLPDNVNDKEYLKILDRNLNEVLDRFQPDFIFFQSGVDPLASDKLGRLGLSKKGLLDRDQFVFSKCQINSIPLAVSMGGGYSPEISDIVDAHCQTFEVAMNLFG